MKRGVRSNLFLHGLDWTGAHELSILRHVRYQHEVRNWPSELGLLTCVPLLGHVFTLCSDSRASKPRVGSGDPPGVEGQRLSTVDVRV